MKKTTVTLLILLFTTMLFVPNTFAEQVVTIPDANLREAIRDALGLPPGAAITSDAMLNLTELLAWGSVTDLTGLEYATNLTGLNLDNQPISNLSPIAGLIQLEWLGLSHTDVSDISPLASLSQLRSLDLGKFRSRNLDTGASESLRLFYGHTDVSDISPLASLTQLERLFLGHTGISDISPLSALTQLTSLDLHSTGVSDISPLASLTQLVKLNLVDCPLNADAHQTHIPAIQANGTEVAFDPFKPIHLPRAPWLVSLIYFRPSDIPVRPNVDAEIDALIKKAQRFFADQLELHGFGRKTFQFETDAHGNAVVHHVNGKFPRMHYVNNGKYKQEIKGQIYISQKKSVTVYMLDSDPWLFTRAGGIGGGGNSGGFADIDHWHWKTIAHELAHAFGLAHDWRADANAKRIRTFTDDSMLTSFCAAEWLSVHPAFNPGQPASTSSATIKMLPPTFASPPTIRLRFEVTDFDGLHQAQLWIPDFVEYAGQYSRLIDYQPLNGHDNTVEFVTTQLTPQIEEVMLAVIDVRGHMSGNSFDIDVASLIPPAKVVSLPDPNLAAAVRESLKMSSSEPLTTHSILNLVKLEARNRGIKDLTGLAHAVNLKELDLRGEYISGEGYVNSNAISDWSPLANLTQLEWLNLNYTDVSDVSPLANLTQLRELILNNTAVSDVSPLANLRQLTELGLRGTAVSDVSPLANLTQLTYLNLDDTAISDISPLANLTQLRELILNSTGVSDISPLTALPQLTRLNLSNTAVSDVSPLVNLTQLTWLSLWDTAVSDVSPLAGLTQLEVLNLSNTAVSDVSPLVNLTQLTWLSLWDTAVSDVSPLAGLTQLEVLNLSNTAVSDVSPLVNLTQLTYLWLNDTAVSDVSPLLRLNLPGTSWDRIGLRLSGSPLSYASLHTHIPALQAKGIEVEFDNVAHQAILKISGDGQEGIGRSALPKPFVVEAMDEHGKPIVGKPVQFSVLEGDGTLSAKTVETDARGKAQVTLTLGWYPDVNKVKATSKGIQSWVLFTAVGTEEVQQLVADVNGDGSVNIQDLVLVAGQFGETGKNSADVNGDGVVNIQDLVLVAGAFGEGAAAPSARAVSLSRLTVSDVEGWLVEARVSIRSGSGDPELQRGRVGQDRLILTSFSRQTHLLSDSGSGDPELQSGSASRPGGLSYLRGLAVLEQLLASLMPKETALLANYPNPFNPETWIPYQLSEPAEVTVTIYAANGAVVRTLDLGHQRAGSYASRHRAAYWDGQNEIGERVASGVYFYTLSAGDFAATRKMLILK